MAIRGNGEVEIEMFFEVGGGRRAQFIGIELEAGGGIEESGARIGEAAQQGVVQVEQALGKFAGADKG